MAELKSGVMMLLADGLDIGELRVSDLIDLHPREINLSRVGANGHRPRVHRQRANAGELQRKAAKELGAAPRTTMVMRVSRRHGERLKDREQSWCQTGVFDGKAD